MTQTALILGASGRFGRHMAAALAKAGWHVRRFDRARDQLEVAAHGVDVIVNGWNPLYPDWATQLPGLHAAVIATARKAGATVILPGNVYVFGARTPGPWSQETVHGATNPLGRLRIDMEAAYRASGVRTILLRAGDFLDTEASGNWFDAVMIRKLDRGIFTYPGDPDAAHAWAYLPDLARAAVMLAERRDALPRFADIPFPGHTLSGREICAILAGLRSGGCRLKRMSWLPLHLVRPVWPMARCLLEMRYLWDVPHRLDDAVFGALLPDFEATSPELALRAAVAQVTPAPDRPRPADAGWQPASGHDPAGPVPANARPRR